MGSRNVESRQRRISDSSILPQTPKRQLSSKRLLAEESSAEVSSPQDKEQIISTIKEDHPDFLGYFANQTNRKIGSYTTLRQPPQRKASRRIYMQKARRT